MKKVKDINLIPKLMKQLKAAGRQSVKVGIFKDDVAQYAAANEFGCRIKVTKKMRAYLHAQGLHLKDSTKEIVIPERSFLRSAFDDNRIIDRALQVAGKLYSLEQSERVVLGRVGSILAGYAKKNAVANIPPENHPFTKEQKGGGKKTLYDQGTMQRSITFKVD